MLRPSLTRNSTSLQRTRPFPLLWKACLAFVLLVCVCSAASQPYVADGGFGRPWEVARLPGSTLVALAFDGDTPFIYWTDRRGVWQRRAEAAAPAELVVEGRGIRQVSAASVHGELALLWVRRDLATGRTRHWLRWRGEDRLLLDALQAYEMSLTAAPSGPAVLVARREGAETVLRLLTWGGGDTVVHRSDQSLVRYRASFDRSGHASVVWLEGFTDRNSLGFSAADWTAYLAEVDEEGDAYRLVELGAARYLGVESQTAVARADDVTRVLWPGPDGEVLFASSSAGTGADTTRTGALAVDAVEIGNGSPLAVVDSSAYWTEGASVRRREVAASAAGTASEVTNVAWSPATILRAELKKSGNVQQLAWTGPTRGGEFRVFASDDSAPFEPGVRDRAAAAMGWNPWGFWEGAIAQVMGSLLAGMLVSMALSPLLWLVAALLVHSRLGNRPTSTGIILGATILVGLLIAAEFLTRSTPIAQEPLFGTSTQAIPALVLAAAVTWWWRRRSDTERLIGILGSSFLFAFVAVSTLAFLTFQTWLDAWSTLL